jgi:hypothetical protein
MTYKGREALEEAIKKHHNKFGKYDCVVGISGGRDSAYALYYLVKICNMRVLAYTADNGFVPEIAKTNMKKMVDILNIDLTIEEHNYLKRCLKNNVFSWLRKPSCPMILMVCSGCRLGMYRGLLRFAKKNNIPMIFLGSGTSIEECDFKEILLTTNAFGNLKIIQKSKTLSLLFGLLYEVIRNPFYFLNPVNAIIYIGEYFYFFHQDSIQRWLYPNQKIICLYEYLKWDENRILSTIRRELNWMQDVNSVSSWRFGCKISFLKNYLLKEGMGFTEKDEILSKMIREKLLNRKDAMERLRKENIIPQNAISEIFEDIGLSPSALNVALEKIKISH